MSTTDRPLAPYEERLLAELRDVVTSRTVPAPAAARTRAARPRLRVAAGLSAAAAVAVAAAIGVPAVLGAGDHPAYAAERGPDGSIRIYIHEYRDAKGLQARLRQLGVAAVVDYVPNGKQCREPRATYIPASQIPRGLLTLLPPEDGAAAEFELHPDLIKPGQAFVFTTTIIGDPHGTEWTANARWQLATGPVSPCVLVPGPVLPRHGG